MGRFGNENAADIAEITRPEVVQGEPLDEALFDVALIGLGPVGATLANLLALRGLRVLALEREAEIYALPRAIHFDGECMRVFQTLGLADALAPDLVVARGMRFVDADGRLLIDWPRPQEIGPQGWHASYRFHQPTLERALRWRLQQHAAVDVRLQHEVLAVEPQADHVDLRLHDLVSGQALQARARYVVGCDGARSMLRRCMDSGEIDLQSHERWLVVDVILHRDKPELGDHTIQYCDPSRPSTYARGTGLRRRWELMLLPHEDATAMLQPAVIWALLARWIRPDEATLERPAVYTFHAVLAEGWRRDRLLIAGDAAHQTPPFMGQGLCAGIRDAANLAWKLAEVIAGRADERLLDTYESERAPHAREFIETAVRLGAVIQARGEPAKAQRDADQRAGPQRFATPQLRLGPGPGAHAGTALSGALLGVFSGVLSDQPALANGTRMDDAVGYEFSLVCDADWAVPARQAVASALTPIRVLAADSSPLKQWLARLGVNAVLLRPDRYIAGTATALADLPGLLELPWSRRNSVSFPRDAARR